MWFSTGAACPRQWLPGHAGHMALTFPAASWPSGGFPGLCSPHGLTRLLPPQPCFLTCKMTTAVITNCRAWPSKESHQVTNRRLLCPHKPTFTTAAISKVPWAEPVNTSLLSNHSTRSGSAETGRALDGRRPQGPRLEKSSHQACRRGEPGRAPPVAPAARGRQRAPGPRRPDPAATGGDAGPATAPGGHPVSSAPRGAGTVSAPGPRRALWGPSAHGGFSHRGSGRVALGRRS